MKLRLPLVIFLLIFSATSYASDLNISIDSLKVLKSSPDSVELEISATNNTGDSVCFHAVAKTSDGINRSSGINATGIPVGKAVKGQIKIFRPPTDEAIKTEALVLVMKLCHDPSTTFYRQQAWTYAWPPVPEKEISEKNYRNSDVNRPSNIIFMNILEEDYPAVDQILRKWGGAEARDVNGQWNLAGFSHALTNICHPIDWGESQAIIKLWDKTYPSIAAIAEANCWLDYAWKVRANRFTVETDPVVLKSFKGRMAQAENALKKAGDLKSVTPLWHEINLEIAVDTRKDAKFTLRLFNDAIKRYPTYFPFYELMAGYWVSKDGRYTDWRKLDEMANRAVVYTHETDGFSYYSLIYSTVIRRQKPEFNAFEGSLATWPRMKAGFDDLIARYPSDRNLNLYAAFACMANDSGTYLILKPRIKNRIHADLWFQNNSPDLCDRKAGQGNVL